jgi:hypothetical protein
VISWEPGQTLNVEVEPCSDARWARIERELFAKLDAAPAPVELPVDHLVEELLARPAPKSRAWLAAAATMGAIAAAVTLVAFLHTSPAGPRVADPVTLTTTDTAMQFVVGESELTMAPESRVVVIGDDEHGVGVSLDRGTVTCEVAPRHGRPPFRVDAGDVHVRVIGTLFTVTRDPASVAVSHGVVEVTAAGHVTVLHDGERWPAALGVQGAPHLLEGHDGSVATATPASPKAKSGPGTRVHKARVGAAPGAPLASDAYDDEPPADDLPASANPAPVNPTPPAADAPAIPTTSPAQQAFEAATRSERVHPDRAATTYRQLAAGTSPWAPNALFALGRLELDRGHRSEAAELFRSYLARYPAGLNAADARELLRPLQ